MALFDRIWEDLSADPPEDRPRVTLSYAQSLDGCITARRGQPLALSGPEALKLTHQLRSAYDGILVGVGTVLADDPQLTVRIVQGPDPQPIILDSMLRTPITAKLLNGRRPSPWICTTSRSKQVRQKRLEQAGARVEVLPTNQDGQVDLRTLLGRLFDLGIDRLMVEGGAQIITAFLKNDLVDHLVLTIAPVIVGGLRAVGRSFAPEIQAISPDEAAAANRFPRLHGFQYENIGDDLIVWGKPRWKRM
jgi:3,4-dihydroxy 2-butanone 4-phosphate synthase/GTP cyclohydrolase II